jgi:hypothetical protein
LWLKATTLPAPAAVLKVDEERVVHATCIPQEDLVSLNLSRISDCAFRPLREIYDWSWGIIGEKGARQPRAEHRDRPATADPIPC